MGAVRNALQALPFPLRLRPFHPPPRLLWKPEAGCWCHWCRGAAWPCRSSDIRGPCCLFVCECARSGCGTPAGAASVTGLPGRHERARGSPRSERRSSGRERSRSGGKLGKGQSPSPACSARLVRASASSSSASSDADERASAMPPPHTGRPGVGGSCCKSDRSASDRDRSPQPGPSGLGSGSRSATGADRSHLEYGGRSSPAP